MNLFSDLTGRRLLILGGIKRMCFLVERARAKGVYVIVADYCKDSPAKKIANESVLLDATDVDSIVLFCKKNAIDGIMTGYSDVLMLPCMKAAKRLGLPTYFTEEMIHVSTDKLAFKTMCLSHGVPVPQTYHVSGDISAMAKRLKYPLFVKPMDGSGSRGAAVCVDQNSFVKNYLTARNSSRSGRVVVEDFLTGIDVGMDYVIIEGQPYLLSMWDRLSQPNRPSAVNHADVQLFPSKSLSIYLAKYDSKVRDMIVSSGFKNGIMFFQGFSRNEEIHLFEMGCRLGGTWPSIDEWYHGVNPLDMLIHFALTGKMVEKTSCIDINPSFGGYAAVFSLITGCNEGRIDKVRGIDEVRCNADVLKLWQVYKEGERFCLGSQTDIALARMQLKSRSLESILDLIDQIKTSVEFYDKDKSLLCKQYNVKQIVKEAYS